MFPCSCILFVTNDTASECIDLDDGLDNKPASSPAIQDRLVMECNILVIHFIFLPMISSQKEALIDQGEVISLGSTSTKDLKHIQLLNTNLFIFGFVLFIYTVCTSESLICFLLFFISLLLVLLLYSHHQQHWQELLFCKWTWKLQMMEMSLMTQLLIFSQQG